MRVLIIGNMGYVGPAVVERLAELPTTEIIGFDTGYFAHCLTPGSVLPERKLQIQHFGDVRVIPASAFSGVTAVVYLAAISNDPMGDAYRIPTRQINHEAAVRSAMLAKAAGVRQFVFASSCSVYGKGDDRPKTESSEVDPLTDYARSKVSAEQDLAKVAGPDFLVTCLRFATACGFGDRLRLDLVLNDLVTSSVCSKRIEILSDGLPWRPIIHIRDMARAIEWAVQRSEGGQHLVVNVGREDCNVQVRDLAAAVASYRSDVEVIVRNVRPNDQRSYQVDFSLFAQLAKNYIPEFTVEKAVQDLWQGLEEIGFAERDFRESQFIRLNALRDLVGRKLLDESLMWVNGARGASGAPGNTVIAS